MMVSLLLEIASSLAVLAPRDDQGGSPSRCPFPFVIATPVSAALVVNISTKTVLINNS